MAAASPGVCEIDDQVDGRHCALLMAEAQGSVAMDDWSIDLEEAPERSRRMSGRVRLSLEFVWDGGAKRRGQGQQETCTCARNQVRRVGALVVMRICHDVVPPAESRQWCENAEWPTRPGEHARSPMAADVNGRSAEIRGSRVSRLKCHFGPGLLLA